MAKHPILKQQQLQTAPITGREPPFQRLYGLRDNPFPSMGLFVASADNDPRQNGEIYDTEFRCIEEEDFFRKFVLPRRGSPVRLGFLRLDPFAGGRGNGKSAFLNRIMHRINEQDWALEPEEQEAADLSALAVHVLPKPREQSNVFALIKLMFGTMRTRGLMDKVDADLRAALLLRLLAEDDVAALAALPAEEVEADLRSPERFHALLKRHGQDRDGFVGAVTNRIEEISPASANNAFIRDFLTEGASVGALWAKWRGAGWVDSDHRWRRYGTEWLTDGLVPVLIAAGYRRLFMLLDEFEKIYMYQTSAKRDEFLDVLRQTFYERDSAAVRYGYVSTVLTIHPSIYEYLSDNWKRVGLDGLAPLDVDKIPHYSVELGASTPAKLEHLIMTYLDAYRTPEGSAHQGTLFPFEKGALASAITKARLYPRGTLLYAYNILNQAADDDVAPPLPSEYVDAFVEKHVLKQTDEDTMFLAKASETDLRR